MVEVCHSCLCQSPASQDVCLVAVQQNGRALRHASEQQQNNKEVVDVALENCTQAGGGLGWTRGLHGTGVLLSQERNPDMKSNT